jgi:hypothetical protein
MNKIQHYLKYRNWYETTFIICFFLINATILATSVIMEATRAGDQLNYEAWKPFVWEYSSAISMMALIPALSWMLNKFPLNWQQLKRTLLLYLFASLIYSGLHIAGMVAIREVVYWTQSMNYDMGNITFELVYEYRKDLWSFIFFIFFIVSYRFILSRLQGEASLVANGEDEPSTQSCDRILVKKLGKEFIIKVEDIEWLESSGNYVNLHIKGRIYPTRATLGGLVEQIAEKGFCRIHRSHGVNLDSIDSITPLNSGDSEVKLLNGKVLNLSRRYKDELKSRIR